MSEYPARNGAARKACLTCGALAVWEYGPAGVGHGRAFCDDCIKRGCSCNAAQLTDDAGRLLPCCEYDFDEDGFPVDGAGHSKEVTP